MVVDIGIVDFDTKMIDFGPKWKVASNENGHSMQVIRCNFWSIWTWPTSRNPFKWTRPRTTVTQILVWVVHVIWQMLWHRSRAGVSRGYTNIAGIICLYIYRCAWCTNYVLSWFGSLVGPVMQLWAWCGHLVFMRAGEIECVFWNSCLQTPRSKQVEGRTLESWNEFVFQDKLYWNPHIRICF